MNARPGAEKIPHSSASPLKAFLLSLPMLAITASMLAGKAAFAAPANIFAYCVTLIFLNSMFFMMIRSGRTDRYRAVVFITMAAAAAFSFISFYLELRGSLGVSPSEIMQGQVPACHIVLPMLALPAFISKTIVFPGFIAGGYASIGVLAVVWLAATLALGKGFCGWFCFLGGFEDGFARIFRVPFIKKIHPDLRLLPFAVLLMAVLTSGYTLTHTYCEWACPFKMVTEFEQVVSFKLLVQSVIFVTLFIGLVVVLPLLTKRRAQCSFFCPFGAMQSLTGKLAPFEIRIEPGKCSRCGKCITECPGFNLDMSRLEKGRPYGSCLLCGKCVDVCPEKAVFFHVKGASLSGNLELQRVFFLYPAFVFLSGIAGMNIQQAILRLIKIMYG